MDADPNKFMTTCTRPEREENRAGIPSLVVGSVGMGALGKSW
jgi:hypothetical protein